MFLEIFDLFVRLELKNLSGLDLILDLRARVRQTLQRRFAFFPFYPRILPPPPSIRDTSRSPHRSMPLSPPVATREASILPLLRVRFRSSPLRDVFPWRSRTVSGTPSTSLATLSLYRFKSSATNFVLFAFVWTVIFVRDQRSPAALSADPRDFSPLPPGIPVRRIVSTPARFLSLRSISRQFARRAIFRLHFVFALRLQRLQLRAARRLDFRPPRIKIRRERKAARDRTLISRFPRAAPGKISRFPVPRPVP